MTEDLNTSSRTTGINYMELNELMNMIYNFMTLGNILALIFCLFFRRTFSLTL